MAQEGVQAEDAAEASATIIEIITRAMVRKVPIAAVKKWSLHHSTLVTRVTGQHMIQ